jgi:hypothetical protein
MAPIVSAPTGPNPNLDCQAFAIQIKVIDKSEGENRLYILTRPVTSSIKQRSSEDGRRKSRSLVVRNASSWMSNPAR